MSDDVKRNYKNYPSDEMARATFTNAEFESAISELRNANPTVGVFRFESYGSDVTVTPNTLRGLADMVESLPGCHLTNSLDIVRGKTDKEIERDILSSRKADMFYHPNSDYYLGDEYVSRDPDA